jgi:hypothetical protein
VEFISVNPLLFFSIPDCSLSSYRRAANWSQYLWSVALEEVFIGANDEMIEFLVTCDQTEMELDYWHDRYARSIYLNFETNGPYTIHVIGDSRNVTGHLAASLYVDNILLTASAGHFIAATMWSESLGLNSYFDRLHIEASEKSTYRLAVEVRRGVRMWVLITKDNSRKIAPLSSPLIEQAIDNGDATSLIFVPPSTDYYRVGLNTGAYMTHSIFWIFPTDSYTGPDYWLRIVDHSTIIRLNKGVRYSIVAHASASQGTELSLKINSFDTYTMRARQSHIVKNVLMPNAMYIAFESVGIKTISTRARVYSVATGTSYQHTYSNGRTIFSPLPGWNGEIFRIVFPITDPRQHTKTVIITQGLMEAELKDGAFEEPVSMQGDVFVKLIPVILPEGLHTFSFTTNASSPDIPLHNISLYESHSGRLVESGPNFTVSLPNILHYIMLSKCESSAYYMSGTLSVSQLPPDAQGLAYSVINYGTEVAVFGVGVTAAELIIPSHIYGIPVTAIADSAFFNNTVLERVVIPAGVRRIGQRAFEGAVNLREVVIPSTVQTIEGRAFQSTGLLEVELPNGISYIGEWAFYRCLDLTAITLPNTVTAIGSRAFHSTALTSITIPQSVTYIGAWTFWDTPIQTIYAQADLQPASWHSMWNMSNILVVWG